MLVYGAIDFAAAVSRIGKFLGYRVTVCDAREVFTTAQRRDDLRAAGLGPAALARLHSPIGLDIGATTPEETALSIAAEIIATRVGVPGHRLSTTSGPIHRR
ncbi:XdhC family protein [Streptomyces sp. NPDC059866]|uniref:XdhC family protein n=1 Tax=Streptomyces sp. NPDC059866 TaxID=3346978 RepID=UPI003658378A